MSNTTSKTLSFQAFLQQSLTKRQSMFMLLLSTMPHVFYASQVPAARVPAARVPVVLVPATERLCVARSTPLTTEEECDLQVAKKQLQSFVDEFGEQIITGLDAVSIYCDELGDAPSILARLKQPLYGALSLKERSNLIAHTQTFEDQFRVVHEMVVPLKEKKRFVLRQMDLCDAGKSEESLRTLAALAECKSLLDRFKREVRVYQSARDAIKLLLNKAQSTPAE